MRTLGHHWPEYLIEAACLGLFMVSAAAFATLLRHPSSPVAPALAAALWPVVQRLPMGMAMGLTAAAIIYSPLGRRSGAHMNPAITLTFLRLGKMRGRDAAASPLGIRLDEANSRASRYIRCDTCDGFPCLLHAKRDAQVICVDAALEHANVTLATNAKVTRRLTSAGGRAVTGVEVERGVAQAREVFTAYVNDVAKVQIYCAWAEAVLGEASFSSPMMTMNK